MKSARTDGRWILSICAAVLAANATADIPSAANACAEGLVETTPSSDFTALENGVVRHERTGLEWRRCVEFSQWTGTGCYGEFKSFTWQGALQHADAISGWRLPNINELRSIVEQCRTDPAVNQQVFPDINQLHSRFWSASPHAGDSTEAWQMVFTGGFNGGADRGSGGQIRLVRGGQ